jgi:hypothetical protein
MTVESAADRAAFLADFGVTVTATPENYAATHPNSNSVTFTAIFERVYVEVANISGHRPVLTCRESDLDDNDIGMATVILEDI